MADGEVRSSGQNIVLRVLTLAVVAGLVQLWVRQHLGWGSDTPWIAAVLCVVAAAGKIVGMLLGKTEQQRLEDKVRAVLTPLVTGTLPMALCALAVLAALVLSSVTIIIGPTQSAGGRPAMARLMTVDGVLVGERTIDRERSSVRFSWVRTDPFGRPYRLAVDGYIEEAVTVYPFVGLQVAPDRDLRRSPSVLFRPPVEAVASLSGGGKFVVTWKDGGASKDVISAQVDHTGAFLVGRAQPLPVATVALWTLELAGKGIQEPALSQMILGWSRPRVVAPATPLAPGMKLVAEVRSRVDKVVARAEVDLGTEPLADVPLIAVASGG